MTRALPGADRPRSRPARAGPAPVAAPVDATGSRVTAGDAESPSGAAPGAPSWTGSSVSTLVSFVAVRRGLPGSMAADRFGLLAVRGDHLLGDVLWHFLIVVERRRERPPAMGQGTKLRGVGE